MKRNIIRQIVDIQAQADRLIRSDADVVEIEQFAQYNNEIKTYLIEHIDDDFILKYIKDIPDLNIEEVEDKKGVLGLIFLTLSLFSGWPALYYEKRKARKSLETVRDIRGKYASVEFMIKNYFVS